MTRHSALLPLLMLCGCVTTPAKIADIDDQRIELVETKASSGDIEAVHNLCYRYIYGRKASTDYAKALLWCTKGAELGVSSSQTLLAEIFYLGYGLPIDYKAAAKWYGAAADQGHPHALLMLYHIYQEGKGVTADQEVARRALKQAVDAKYGAALEVQAELDGARR